MNIGGTQYNFYLSVLFSLNVLIAKEEPNFIGYTQWFEPQLERCPSTTIAICIHYIIANRYR